MAQEMKAAIKKFTEEVWNKGNLEAMAQSHSRNLVCHFSGVPELMGFEATKQYIAETRTAFPDFQVKVEEVLGEGDSIAERWTAEATFTGPSNVIPVPPTGKHASVKGTWVGHWEKGKVVEEWYTFDMLDWLQQCGAMPPSQ